MEEREECGARRRFNIALFKSHIVCSRLVTLPCGEEATAACVCKCVQRVNTQTHTDTHPSNKFNTCLVASAGQQAESLCVCERARAAKVKQSAANVSCR